MADTRHEQARALAARMSGVFDVRWDAGVSAGEAFDAAKAALVRRLESDAQLVREMTFYHFAQQALHSSVGPDTVRDPTPPDPGHERG